MTTAAGKSLLVCLWVFSGIAFCQTSNADFDFVNHLSSRKQYREAIYLLHFDPTAFAPDSINFLLGYNHHLSRKTDSAAFYFGRVPPASAFADHAVAYGVLNYMYGKQRNQAMQLLGRAATDAERQQVFLLLAAGSRLLDRNYAAFDSVAAGFSYFGYEYREEQSHLMDLRKRIPATKKKSPVVAGLLSAAVPGLGKFYAGKKGAGMAAFLTNAILAGFAAEALYRSGYRSPQFFIFGGAFACFYAGNIVGSVYSVKLQRRSDNGRIDNEILGTLHQSVDRAFGL